MPTTKKVKCTYCGRIQDDLQRGSNKLGATCEFCGNSPLPTWSVPVGHWLHPEYLSPAEVAEAHRKAAAAKDVEFYKRRAAMRRTKVPTLRI